MSAKTEMWTTGRQIYRYVDPTEHLRCEKIEFGASTDDHRIKCYANPIAGTAIPLDRGFPEKHRYVSAVGARSSLLGMVLGMMRGAELVGRWSHLSGFLAYPLNPRR